MKQRSTTPAEPVPRDLAEPPLSGPIFLVGTGRCGSSITYSLLAMHPELAWIPSWMNVLPGLPQVAVFNRLWDLPWTDSLRHTRFLPNPTEPSVVFSRWDPSYPGESVAESEGEAKIAGLRSAMESVRRWHGKPRLLLKMVGRPVKVDLLHRLFPDALFVHITRTFRPTVCSLVRVDFFEETGSLDPWPWGPIPREQLELYDEKGKTAELTAAIQLDHNLCELEKQLQNVPESQRTEFRYADLVNDPVLALQELASFAHLPMDEALMRRLDRRVVRQGADERWRSYFTPEQQRNLDRFQEIARSHGASKGS